MRSGRRRRSAPPTQSTSFVDDGIRVLMGGRFRAELRGALLLRRIPFGAVRAEDAEEIRADAAARFIEGAASRAGGISPRDEVQRVIGVAVYHRFCRDVRRRRSRTSLPGSEEPVVLPPTLPDVVPAPTVPSPERASRRRLGSLAIRGAVVDRARDVVGRLLGEVSSALLERRAGESPTGGDRTALRARTRATGVIRWLREFEGDRRGGGLARDLVRCGEADRMARPGCLVVALRDSARWRAGSPRSLACLAHAAITALEPGGPPEATSVIAATPRQPPSESAAVASISTSAPSSRRSATSRRAIAGKTRPMTSR